MNKFASDLTFGDEYWKTGTIYRVHNAFTENGQTVITAEIVGGGTPTFTRYVTAALTSYKIV